MPGLLLLAAVLFILLGVCGLLALARAADRAQLRAEIRDQVRRELSGGEDSDDGQTDRPT